MNKIFSALLVYLSIMILPAMLFSQTITVKDLIGKWERRDNALSSWTQTYVNFIDSSNYLFVMGNSEELKATYHLDSLNGMTILNSSLMNLKGHNMALNGFIKISKDTLKMQIQMPGEPPLKNWLPETISNTLELYKKK